MPPQDGHGRTSGGVGGGQRGPSMHDVSGSGGGGVGGDMIGVQDRAPCDVFINVSIIYTVRYVVSTVVIVVNTWVFRILDIFDNFL